MLWTVAAPFFETGAAVPPRWLDDFVPGDRHRFLKIDRPAVGNWHARGSRATPLGEWGPYWTQASRALAARPDGVVTLFPQLAAMAGLRRALTPGRKPPILAWCFNIGELPGGAKRHLARAVLRGIERFVVHSTAEVAAVRDWLDLPAERVRFIHLQRAPIPIVEAEDEDQPFLLAMGSANRDYATFFEALRRTGLPATVVAGARSLAGLDVPATVKVLQNLDSDTCLRLAQRARVNVVPLADTPTASGQVTVVEAMRLNRPVVASAVVGTVDYVEDGVTGRLVPPGDPAALAAVLRALWNDATERRRLAANAAAFAERHLSDEAAGAALGRLLDEIAEARGRR